MVSPRTFLTSLNVYEFFKLHVLGGVYIGLFRSGRRHLGLAGEAAK
jgi:hypothetical protein